MARQVLALHFKASRWLLLPFVLAAFGLPLLVVQGLGSSPGGGGWEALDLVRFGEAFRPLFPSLAAAVGGVLALTAWHWDHRGDHVYALSLPVARWEWAMLKMGAGVVLLGIPVAAFLLGSLAATASVDLPAGLAAYPLALSARFGLSALVVYALVFAMAAGTKRTTVVVLSTLVGGLFLGEMTLQFVASTWHVRWLEGTSLVESIFHTVTAWPGPFQVLFGDWMLIDV